MKVRWKLRCCIVGLEEIEDFLLLLFFDTGSLRKSPQADLVWEATGSASSCNEGAMEVTLLYRRVRRD